MLVKATMEDIERYGEWVYNIALDQNTYEILLFFHENRMEGWIQYFWIEKDKYLQLSGCNINTATEQALRELMALLEERFEGYSLYFGCPKTNVGAIDFLLKNGFECIEEAYNNSFFFDRYELQSECKEVAAIDRKNFADFRTIHAQMEEDTYWTCDRIFNQIDTWKIYVYYENEIPVGTIFLSGDESYLEIFGIEFAEGKYSRECFTALMTAALNKGKRLGAQYLTFFCDAEAQTPEKQAIIEELGFCYVGQYVCYLKNI